VTASYDAAQTVTGNQNHWSNADNLDPHSANNPQVRRQLRTRSRYEVVENNPYLKGIYLTICNDFIGSGPKLQITDPRWKSKARRKTAETAWDLWAKAVCLRQKLWRMRMQKGVDGESFALPFTNDRLYRQSPITLDFYLIEAERCTSFLEQSFKPKLNEVDGVRFDQYNVPVEYHVLNYSPGASVMSYILAQKILGQWMPADRVIHWFRQDRGWLRGVPETATCLPLCALLRRYTLAVVRAAEIAASFSAVLETEGPASGAAWTDGKGNLLTDDPFDTFPFEMGMITTMPWGYKLNQMKAEQPTTVYDQFVAALLREISRPLLVPFNLASGTSKDSNMASAVVDTHIYKTGQHAERFHCEDYVLDKMFAIWWQEFALNDMPTAGSKGVPQHRWRWDQVGLDHTDPVKVATSLQIYREEGMLTDRDIQEGRFNRDYEEWQEEITETLEFRKKIGLTQDPELEPKQAQPSASSGSSGKKPKPKSSSKSTRSNGK
jgi:capsid protein